MNRITAQWERLRRAGRKALIPFITAGDPDLETTKAIVHALVAGGADLIEIGIPYSDPLADGPTIQKSSKRALDGGVTIERIHQAVRELREEGVDVPLLYLVYYNCVFRHGEERFVADAAAAGVDGLIVPDLPVEESDSLRQVVRRAGLHLIQLLAPTSTPERIRKIAECSEGFIYCVSLTGVTGARERLSETLPAFLARIREHTSVPLAVGFGVSTPEQAARVGQLADGVIVGSALIQALEPHHGSREATAGAARTFIEGLRAALDDVVAAGSAPSPGEGSAR